MQLSVLIPTNRRGLLVCSRIAQACSWAGPNIEVIIRDNSGDAEKRALLAHFRRDNCQIIVSDPCPPLENVSDIIRRAKGEFVFLLADDDFCFDHAIPAIQELIERFGKDSTVVGVTGSYLVETTRGSTVANYAGTESDDVVSRVSGYLSNAGPNILHYAPVRREIVQNVFSFMNSLPFYFSFHDQVVSLLYLLNGKFVRLNRLMYLYDLGVWEKGDGGQKADVGYYRGAGLDPGINKLHWFLCGFEGALLARNLDNLPDYATAQRQLVADYWFATMFARFKGHTRLTFGSSLSDAAEKLTARLLASTGQLSFQGMLTEICGFLALSSQNQADGYFAFWDAIINKRKPPARRAIAASG